MRNFIQNGDVVTMTAPYSVSSGEGVCVGALFGIAACNAAEGDEVEVSLTGVFSSDKTGGGAITPGTVLFWDPEAKRITPTPGPDRPRVGHALNSVPSGAGGVLKFRLAP